MRVNHFKEHVDRLLLQGMRNLSMTLGVLARIENDNYEIIAVQSNSGAYVPGEKFALGATYCRRVFAEQRIVAASSVDDSSLTLHHPLYRSLPLESYLGAPVLFHGRPWGCLDFSSMAQRDENFGAANLALIDDLAHEISRLLDSDEITTSRL